MTSNQTDADDGTVEPPEGDAEPASVTTSTEPADGGDETPSDDPPAKPAAVDGEGAAAPADGDPAPDEGARGDGGEDPGGAAGEDHGDTDQGDEDHGDEDHDEDDEGPSRVVLLVGAAVAFVAIAIVGVLIASGGGDGGGGGDGEAAAPSDARTDVAVFGTIDQFDRPDSAGELGDFAPGRPWSADAGTWGIEDGEAYLVESAEFRNHAVVGLGQGDGGAQVRLDQVVNGAGLVFRYVGPYNYWAVVAVPDVATWNVVKVVDGDQEVVGNTGQSPTADGTTVGVRMRGDTIDVIINGRVRKTIVDDFQAEAGKVGLTARGPDSGDARFDDFVAGLPNGVPLSGGQGGGAAATGGGGSSSTTDAP
ncbi:MAG: hypothetical protein KDB10_21430 [Acidimicrobiales bacterium]|nr:hypothetical protein [Acidimicrobiales bacterium]